MGRISKLRDLIGKIKDTASQSKAAIVSKPKNLTLHLALLRATSHDTFSPPNPKHLSTLLSFGNGSRATAAAAVEALMDRLQSTHDSSVAIKCLLVVHHIVKHGSFILQDQLSIYPSTGGRNYLNLSNFRDDNTPATWELSSWIRWYARYLEHLIYTYRVLGYFLCSTSSTAERDQEEDRVTSLMNSGLLKEIDSLVNLTEEICKRPDTLHMGADNTNNNVVEEIMGLVGDDYLSAINAISTRVDEFNHRQSCLSLVDSVELVCVLKRLEDCKEGLLLFSTRKKALIESLWCSVSEMKDKVGMGQVYSREKGKLLLTMRNGESGSESARFGDQDLRYDPNLLKFSSARFGFN